MGQSKLCLPWGESTILGHILQQWREAGATDLLVVHAPGEKTSVVLELDRLDFPQEQRIETLAPERDMMGSVVTAARHAGKFPSLSHLIIALGDQPHIHLETLRALLKACQQDQDRIVRVVFNGKPGHPLALPAHLLEKLSTTSSETLRDFIGLSSQEVCDLTCCDSGVLLDLDTPDEYAQGLRQVDQPLT